MHFKSKAGYGRWLAYGHMHGAFKGPGVDVFIRGKKHKVHHGKRRR
jgi:hypothetical protein